MNAVKLPEYFARLHLEAGLVEITLPLGEPPEIHRAAGNLKPDFADSHSQCSRPGPGRKEGASGEFPYDLKPGQRVCYIVPKSDCNDEIKNFRGLPIEYIAQNELAAVSDTVALHKLSCKIQHLGSEVQTRDLATFLSKRVYEAP